MTTATARRTGFGVDIGGSGIKGAPVDLDTGQLLAERLKFETPAKSSPDAVAQVVGQLVAHFGWTGPLGVTFPAVIKDGIARTAANVDKSWIGTNVHDALRPHVPGEIVALNDADAAGLAEVRFGAAKGPTGVVLVLTLGTGIGSALLLDGKLFPSAELGHLKVDGKEAERRASAAVRERKGLSWKRWAAQLQLVLEAYEALLWPDLIVIGGGVSREADKFLPLLRTRARLVPAELQNAAGVVGAAIWASEHLPPAPARPTRKAAKPTRRATPTPNRTTKAAAGRAKTTKASRDAAAEF
jgi:polyphosphate glucokinase